jgi:hypothetical protein
MDEMERQVNVFWCAEKPLEEVPGPPHGGSGQEGEEPLLDAVIEMRPNLERRSHL